MNWRVVTAVVTVVLAGLTAVLIYSYVNKADERAQDKVKQVTILAARGDIPAGMTGSEAIARGLIGPEQIPQKNVPDGAIAPAGQAAISSLAAAADLSKGQPITSSLFVEKVRVAGGVEGELQPGDMAISFSVDQPHGVANLIQPGDSINLIYSGTAQKVKTKSDPQADGTAQVTAFLLPGLKVLAVGTTQPAVQSTVSGAQPASSNTTTTTSPENRTPQNLGLITVEVNPRQAEQIAHAQYVQGKIYVTLNAPGFDPKTFKLPAEIVEFQNLFDQRLSVLENYLNQLP
jgi:Flp pilus assembly protein CpaB